jgi:hypothetical protein
MMKDFNMASMNGEIFRSVELLFDEMGGACSTNGGEEKCI